MAATHRCVCGATIEYKQDMVPEPSGRRTMWLCRACRTEVPSVRAEQIRHQHPS